MWCVRGHASWASFSENREVRAQARQWAACARELYTPIGVRSRGERAGGMRNAECMGIVSYGIQMHAANKAKALFPLSLKPRMNECGKDCKTFWTPSHCIPWISTPSLRAASAMFLAAVASSLMSAKTGTVYSLSSCVRVCVCVCVCV